MDRRTRRLFLGEFSQLSTFSSGKALRLRFAGLVTSHIHLNDTSVSLACVSRNGVIAHYVMEICPSAQILTPFTTTRSNYGRSPVLHASLLLPFSLNISAASLCVFAFQFVLYLTQSFSRKIHLQVNLTVCRHLMVFLE